MDKELDFFDKGQYDNYMNDLEDTDDDNNTDDDFVLDDYSIAVFNYTDFF